jgi:outer membrane protein assembly factor BamB
MPGGLLAVSANGAVAGSGILWALTGKGDANWKSVPGVLRAFDATDLSKEIWNSDKKAGRDRLGLLAKFNTPVVANGKVYVATFSKQVSVYGLLSGLGSR